MSHNWKNDRQLLIMLLFSFLLPLVSLAEVKEHNMYKKLTDELIELNSQYPGKIGIYCHDLKTGQKITLNADEQFFMASTYKVPILIQLYRDHEAGLLSLADKIELTGENIQDGYGLLRSFTPGTVLSLKEIALLMITISDNIATNLILEQVKAERVNVTLKEYDIVPMSVDRSPKELLKDLERDRNVFYQQSKDSTTPRAMGILLEKLMRGELATRQSYEQILSILNQQLLNNRIPRKLMSFSNVKIAHKTGTTNRVINDVAIIQFVNRPPVILCVYTYKEDEKLPMHVAEELIGEIAYKIVHAHLLEEQKVAAV